MGCKALSKMIQYEYTVNIFKMFCFANGYRLLQMDRWRINRHTKLSATFFDEKFADLSQKPLHKQVNLSFLCT